jgi:hypothetical protein
MRKIKVEANKIEDRICGCKTAWCKHNLLSQDNILDKIANYIDKLENEYKVVIRYNVDKIDWYKKRK